MTGESARRTLLSKGDYGAETSLLVSVAVPQTEVEAAVDKASTVR